MKSILLLVSISIVAATIAGQDTFRFDSDEDLSAWHEFGLKHFYGHWSVIQRKKNGDLIRYSDYGLPISDDFRPIDSPRDDSRDSQNTESFAAREKRLEESILRQMLDYSQNEGNDTLELIGIVGIVESNENSSEKT